jgi:thioesterase domain-containing protein/acyl carrier protein
MVPGQIVFLPALPLSANGKLDRRALPEPEALPSTATYVAPRDPTEEILAGIWAEVLGVERVSIHDNFFDLGGHSLLAMRLIRIVRETFDATVQLVTLLEAPNIAHLAERLRQMRKPHRFSIVSAIQSRGVRPPLFCVHPAGGTSLCYAGLARYLGPEQPLYGVQAVGSDGMEAPLTSIEEMAARYIAEMRTIQPHGPFRICGWSLGGIVAYEMGRQLYQEDRNVSPLFLIDSYAPPLPAQEPLGFLPFMCALSANGLVSVPENVLKELECMPPARQLARFMEITRDFRDRPAGSNPKEVVGLWLVYIANMRAGQRYRPTRWPSVIRLLRASGNVAASASSRLGWTQLAAALDTRVITGSHESLLSEPFLGLVAAHLDEWLNCCSACNFDPLSRGIGVQN